MPHRRILAIDPDEEIIFEITRHPIGWMFILWTGILINALILFGIIFVALNGELLEEFQRPAIFLLLGMMLLAALITYIGVMIYRNNRLTVTSQNLVQQLQHSLVNRKISQLSLAKIQDVSVEQRGILATVFNYGKIDIETAGEEANFAFEFAVNPYENAKFIIEAHEQFIKSQMGQLQQDF